MEMVFGNAIMAVFLATFAIIAAFVVSGLIYFHFYD